MFTWSPAGAVLVAVRLSRRALVPLLVLSLLVSPAAPTWAASPAAGVVKNASLPSQLTIGPKQEENPADQPIVPTAEATPGEEVPPASPAVVPASVLVDVSSRLAVVTVGEPFTVTVSVAPTSVDSPLAAGLTVQANLPPGVAPADGAAGTELSWTLPALAPGTAQTQVLQLVADGSATLLRLEVVVSGEDVLPVMQLHWLAVAPASAVTEEPTATPAATPTPLAQATLSPTATATEVSATPTAGATASSLTTPAVAVVDTLAATAGETPAPDASSSTPEPIPPTATPTLLAPAASAAGTEAGTEPLPGFYAASLTSAEVGAQGAVVQSNSGGVTLALGAGAVPAGAVVAYAPLWDWHSSAPPATPPVTPTELPTAEPSVPEPASLAHLFLPNIEGRDAAQATGSLSQASDIGAGGDNGKGDAPAVPSIEDQGITFYALWTLGAHTATPAGVGAEVAVASATEIEQLSAEALLVVSVADLAAEGIAPQQLQLWTREETGEPWTALAATYDGDAQVLRAWLPHFSQFGLGAGLSPSGDLLPSVQAFTADVLTGGATASIAIDAPAGLGGLKPNLGLSYSSVLMDDLYRKGGANNMTAQGGAAGFGWNLGGVSYIARSDGKLDDDTADTLKTFAMVLGGERVEISYMSGAWHTNPEIFAKIDWPGDRSGEAYDFAGWTVTSTDGTRYEFGDTGAFAGFATTSANAYTLERTTGGLTYRLTRRWYLRKVTDALGNSMQYSYKTERAYKTCSVEQQWINNGSNWYTSSVDPLEIAYSGNAGAGAEYRLRVQFVYGAGARGDTQVENWSPSGCNSSYPSQPMVGSYNQLSSIAVQVKNVSAAWQTIKSYYLVQYAQAFSAGSTKYRYYLAYLYEKGLAGGTLRRYGFTYSFSNLNQVWLTNADNSWGGSVGYSYAAYRISCSNSVCPNTMFRYPVATTIAYDAPYPPPAGVPRNSVQTSYSYGPVNSPGGEGGAVANDGGFLGFKEVTVLHYDVNATTSLLQKEVVLSYQDGAQASRDNPDPRQGKVKQRTVYAGDGTTVLQAQQYDWQAYWYLNGAWSGTPTTTSWRLNNGEAQYPPTWTQLVTETVTLGTPGSGAPWTRTVYAYKTAQQNGGQYGNRTTASEYVDNALKRRTETEYYPNATAYIVDKPARVRVYDAAGSCVREVRSVYDRYDDNNNYTLAPVKGLLTETAQALAACADVAAINKANTAWQIERFAYDSYGNQTIHHLVGAGDGSQDQWTDTDYDATFHLFPVKRYDAVRPEIQETATYHGVNAPAVTSSWVYWGAMAEWCDVNGICTRQAYDQFGRRIFRWDNQVRGSAWPTVSTGAAVRWDYRDPYNNAGWKEVTVAEWSSPRCYGNFVRRHYNGFGQLTQEQKPNQGWEAVVAGECGAVTAGTEIDVDYAYDGLGRQVKVSVPHATAAGWVNRPPDWSYGAGSTAYDALGRVTTTTAPNGEQTLTSYSGRATKVVGIGRSGDSNKVLQWTEVDGFGNLSNVRSGNSAGTELARVTLGYDTLGNLKSVVQSGLSSAAMTYDLGGRKTAMSDPDLGTWTYAYNRRGQLTRQTDARGWTTCLYYDSLGRLASKYFQTSSTCPTSNSGGFRTIYTYDAGGGVNLGQLTSVAKYNGSGGLYVNHSWSYNSAGRLASAGASVLGSAWHYTSYGYDAYNRPATLTYPDGEQLTTTYGAWGQPIKLQSSTWGVLVNGPMKDGPVSDAAAYDVTTQLAQTNYPAGNLIRNQTYYGWTSSDANNLGYANHRLANITVRTISTSLYRYATYLGYDTYASLKSRSEFVDNVRQENYTFKFDDQNRVSSGSYDGYNGNPITHTVTYTYADAGWPLRFETNGGTAFTQFRGHLSVPVPASYAYDANGNLTARLSKPGQTGSVPQALTWGAENFLDRVTAGGLDESYFYDENGMRAGKKDNLTGVVTYYFFPHYENRNGVVTKYYSFGDMLVAKSEGGVLTYLHTDALGSVALETNTAGAVLADQRYYAYGRRLDTSGDTSGERDYTGQKIDQTGLLYYNARYYDPQLGQFISPDTLVPEPTNLLSYNRYLYAKGNPVKYGDPSGHIVKLPCPEFWCGAVVLDYSQQDSLTKLAIEGLSTAGCLFAGCTVDYEGDKVVGPTEHEYAEQTASNALGMGISPIGTIKIPGLSAKLNRIAEEVIGERQVSGSGLEKITWMLTQRQAYEDAVMAIEPEAMKMVNDGASVETAGRWAFGQRKVLQGTYQVGLSRNVLSDIGDRQLGHYGNVGGIQTAEQALERAGSWEGVIKSASKPGGDDIIRQVLKYYLDGGQ